MLGRLSIGKIIGFIVFLLAVILLIILIKNDWNVPAAVDSIFSLLGKG